MQREATNQDFPVNFRGIALTGQHRNMHRSRKNPELPTPWLQILSYNGCSPFTIVTKPGWSRYDHFASLCELLPVAVPRSTLSTSPPWSSPPPSAWKSLHCHSMVNLIRFVFFSLVASLLVLSLGSLQLPVSRRFRQNYFTNELGKD